MITQRIANFSLRKTSTLQVQVLSSLQKNGDCRDDYKFKYASHLKHNAYYHNNCTKQIRTHSCVLPLSKNLAQNGMLRPGIQLFSMSQVRHVSDNALDIESIKSEIPSAFQSVAESQLVEACQNSLLWVHSITGLPWWASITLSAFAVRTLITLPLSVNQIRLVSKMEQVSNEMEDVGMRLQKVFGIHVEKLGIPFNIAEKNYKSALKKEWNDRVIKYNCHPFKSIVLVLIQLPVWISMSFAVRNLCTMMPHFDFDAHRTHLELMVGGFGWVNNLTAVDPYYVLPITIGVLNLCISEMHHAITISEVTRFEVIRRNIFRVLAVAIIPISSFMPAALNLYWLSSSFYGLLQTLTLSHPKVRKLAGANIDHPKYQHPYRHFALHARSLFSLAKKEKKLTGMM